MTNIFSKMPQNNQIKLQNQLKNVSRPLQKRFKTTSKTLHFKKKNNKLNINKTKTFNAIE